MPLYSTACPLPLNRKISRHRVSTSPIPTTGLSLWLKADAGINMGVLITQIILTGFTGIYTDANGTYDFNGDQYSNGSNFLINNSGEALFDDNTGQTIATNNNNSFGTWTPANFLSTITLSNAGTSSVNGVYTRTDTSVDVNYITFYASGGRIIVRDGNDGDFWLTTNDEYRNNGNALGINDWVVETGDSPAPTAVNLSSPRNVGSPTSTTTIVNYVSEWLDQTGNGNNANATGTPSLSTVSGKTFVDFAGGYFTGNELLTQLNSTIMVVARFSAARPVAVMFEQFDGADILAFYRGNADDYTFAMYNGSPIESVATTNDNQTYIFGITTDEFYNGNLYLNGTADESGYIGEQTPSGSYYLGRYVSAEITTTEMKMAEIVIYNRVLTTPERQQVESYLNTKYSIY